MARIWEYSQISEVVLAILTSIILYAFRTKLKIIYGLIEVVAGLYLLYLSTHTSTGSGLVIAHPTPASISSVRLADITNRTVSSTEERLALAVLTTDRKAA